MAEKEKISIERAKELYLACELDRAFPMFVQLGVHDNAEAMYFLGEYFAQGYGHTKADMSRAFKWRKKGAMAGNPLALLNLAYGSGGRGSERYELAATVFPTILKMAEDGDIFAQNELPDMYYFGIGVPRSIEMALYWLEKAAARGFWRPLTKLGELYHYGDGVAKDTDRAEKYYEKAAAMGYGTAEANLAMLLLHREKRNMPHCVSLLRRAFAHGCAWPGAVASALGTIIIGGEGVPADEKEGVLWLRRSDACEFPEGTYYLALCCEKGIGTPIDLVQAKKLCKKAADKDYIEAAVHYGILLRESGEPEEAMRYFKKAAEKGDPDGEGWFASCYLYGIGTEMDRGEARRWLEKAAAHGNQDAVDMLWEELGVKYSK